jgi:polyhydroxyalkanoate synthesis regulator phasin
MGFSMADEYVVIRIKIKANDKEIDKVNRKLVQVGATSRIVAASTNKLSAATGQYSSAAAAATKSSKSLSNVLDKDMGKSVKKTSNGLKGLIKGLAAFNKIALIVFGVSLVVAAASLASVNALFATGRFLVQSYRVAMQGVAVGVASVGAALATVAAAMREYNAALFAFNYKSGPQMENGLRNSQTALRLLQNDAQLAVFGMEALNGAFASLSKGGLRVDGTSIRDLRLLADFAAAGGDPSKGLQSAAEFLSIVRKEGRLTEEALQAGSAVSEEFGNALKQARGQGVSSYNDLMKVLSEGNLEASKRVAGQAATVQNTLVGRFKSFVVEIRNVFSDIGLSLLEPVTNAMSEMMKIIRDGVLRIAPDFVKFGQGRFLDGLVNGVQKLTDLLVDVFRKYIGGSVGMLDRFVSWWKKVEYWFGRVVDSMRPLLDGGRAIIDMFGPAIGAVFSKIGDIIKTLDRLVVNNRKQWQRFAEAVEDAVVLAGDFIIFMVETFDRALPALTPIVEVLTSVAYSVMSFLEGLQKLNKEISFMNDGLKSMVSLLEMIGLLIAGLFFKKAGGGKGLIGKATGAAITGAGFVKGRRGRGAGASGSTIPGVTPIAPIPGLTPVVPTGPSSRIPGQPTPGIPPIAPIPGLTPVTPTGPSSRTTGWGGFIDRTKGKMGGNRLPKSMGFGPGLALTALSLGVDDDAQGGVGRGAMLAGLAPMLGKAGPAAALAGVGLAGYSIAKNAKTGAGGALGGAMAGGAAGAAIGSVIPVIGTVTGALVGAAAGAMIGWVKGNSNRKKLEVQKVVEKYSTNLFNETANAMVVGKPGDVQKKIDEARAYADRIKELNETVLNSDNFSPAESKKIVANRLVAQGVITEDESKAFVANSQEFIKQTEQVAKQMSYLQSPLDKYNTTMDALGRRTGKTQEELHKLSLEMGVNLYDDTMALSEVMSKLGLAVEKTSEQIVGALRDIGIGAITDLEKQLEASRQPALRDEIANNYRDLLKSGTATEEDLNQMIIDFSRSLMIEFPDNPAAVMQELFDQFGAGGIAFGDIAKGGFLEGFEGDVREYLNKILGGFKDTALPKMQESLIEDVVNAATVGGFDIDRAQVAASVSTMGFQQLEVLTKALTDGNLFAPMRNVRGRGDVSGREGQLAEIGLGNVELSFLDDRRRQLNSIVEDEAKLREEFFGIVSSAFENAPGWMKDTPLWWEGPIPYPNGDTATPRGFGDSASSRFSRTMKRHSSIDNALTGKRSVTSGLRNFALGSINSDHVTGRALDLTGQNLGAYATMTNKMGGFAEFHGTGGDRHLHVVPGEGPVGDTMAPVSVGSQSLMLTPRPTVVAASPISVNANITVNGAQNPNAVAAEVKKAIDGMIKEQRSLQERR